MLDYQQHDEGLRHYQRGVILERANRMAEAVEEYRQAVALDPHLREAHVALAFYYQRAGLLAKAVDQFQTVVNLEGDFLGYFNLGYLMIELERYDDALVAFEACLSYEPDDPATHFELAYIHCNHGKIERALEHLQYPLASYPDDWEIYNLAGKCYLHLRQYEQALAAFGQALLLAPGIQIQSELLDNIAMVERYREFRSLQSAKDQMYARDGIVYLGSAQDNGIRVAEVQDYHFTYPDISTTVQRLMAICKGKHWQFTGIVSIDALSLPLARALSELLDAPIRTVHELTEHDTVLLVMAVAREAELLLVASEHIPCTSVAFCMGLNWLRHNQLLPDIVGIVARGVCSVPWEAELRRLRADGAGRELLNQCIERATHQIMQAVHDIPPEGNLSRQVRYYTRKHRRLSFSTL
ncbi:MAG: tetratricopeptide repeat protein [Chloroflexaceae bacterium]|nr:tetratricopeptide repeat protein [Chloroflexaceae bacterium]NJL33891.1 tetratricopeptide repeat protein [Chloroflexaceae bacterium]NJO05382.1 tetratricopeptide repeat protein [Chloroflexaceae bacterium]